MNDKSFDKPIYLRDGKRLVQEIASVFDAIDFLEAWPEKHRDLLHDATLRTCIMAHDGLKPVKVARDAIRSFATKKGILEKEPAVQPWMIKPTSGGRATA